MIALLAALTAGTAVVLAAAGWASAPTRWATGHDRRGATGPMSPADPGDPSPSPSPSRSSPVPVATAVSPRVATRATSAKSGDGAYRIGSKSGQATNHGGGRPSSGVVGWAVAVAVPVVAAFAFGPTLAVVLVVSAVVVRATAIRRVRQRTDRLLDQALPELIDLLAIAASAGQPVPACLTSVAERAPGVLRPVLVRAHRRIDRGEPVAVALTDAGPGLGALGPVVVEALAVAHQTGAPLQPALQRVAAVARDRRRRAAEEAARRLPVTLLFPLVCCVLPAFVLLAVVPLLATSLQSLQP